MCQPRLRLAHCPVGGESLDRKRRRNLQPWSMSNSHTKAKSRCGDLQCNLVLEAVMGYLHMTENLERLESLFVVHPKVEG